MARGRGFLEAALAAAMAVAPSLAQDGKVAPAPKTLTEALIAHGYKPTMLRLAGDYSETYPGIVIAIAKGQKDPITGEKIGDTLSGVIKKLHGAPSKYFVEPGGDYTAIAFFVKGHAYGPYGLKESLGGIALAADNYDEQVRHGVFPPPDSAANSAANQTPGATTLLAAKPEPHQ